MKQREFSLMVGMRMNGISAVKHNLTISSIVDNMLILHHGNLSISFSFTNMDLIACTDIVFQCTILFVVKKNQQQANYPAKGKSTENCW